MRKILKSNNVQEYWSERYKSHDIPWDVGSITTPIKDYIDQIIDKDIKILIPGVGNGYELAYLFQNGFKNVYGLDISDEPLENFVHSQPNFPKEQLIQKDFFAFEGTFDLIIEQTFFCALSPELRQQYADKMLQLLKPEGKLVGVLFDFPLTESGPPFGGNFEEYYSLFSPIFVIHKLEKCYNSIKPRANKEYFISLQPR